jgi:hypothetical protein
LIISKDKDYVWFLCLTQGDQGEREQKEDVLHDDKKRKK